MTQKPKIFLDASVIFAGCLSATGASREIIKRVILGEFIGVISETVLEEARKNLASKVPHVLPAFEQLMNPVFYEFVEPGLQAVVQAQEYTVAKDAPIVAAAKATQVDYLATLDKKHLSDASEVIRRSGLNIVSPGELMREIRENSEQ